MEFEKYHKIRIIGDEENKEILSNPDDEIIIEEKIDGGNFRVFLHGKKVVFGSRTQELGGESPREKMFIRAVKYVRDEIADANIDTKEPIILYMENCVKHSLNYDWEKIPPVLGFDVKTESGYLDYDLKCSIFNQIGIPIVPLVKRCKAREITVLDESLIPKSDYASPSATNQLAEGVVIKNYSKQLFAKLVRSEFKEVAKETFGMNKKYAENDDEELVAIYCTNARMDKIIFKLIDEGKSLGMGIAGDLIKRTWTDIIDENAKDILLHEWTLSIRNVRKLIAKRCISVLKNVIQNNALNEVEE